MSTNIHRIVLFIFEIYYIYPQIICLQSSQLIYLLERVKNLKYYSLIENISGKFMYAFI